MTTYDPNRLEEERPHVRGALISGDDRLRSMVFAALEADTLPLRIDADIVASPSTFETEHLERTREGDPHVVLLDMSDDPARAVRLAGQIAAVCPRAAVIGIGPDLDSSLLLEAMRAGVVEYLPRPLEVAALVDAVGRVLRKNGWMDTRKPGGTGELLTFFAAKGGTGATTVMTNLGIELHRQTGRKTLLVDLDLELGEIASLLGVRPRFHFVDLVRNFHRMDADLLPSYIEQHDSGVHVLSAPFEPEIGEQVTGEQITRILGFLRRHYDYVLVDASKSLDPPALAALQGADSIVLITNMDVPSLRNLKRCLPILDRVTANDAERIRLVVNRFNPKSLVRREDLEETLGLEIFATLSNDYETVIESISTGRPLVLEGGSAYASELQDLARRMVVGDATAVDAAPSLVGRLLSPFRSKASRRRAPVTTPSVEAVNHG